MHLAFLASRWEVGPSQLGRWNGGAVKEDATTGPKESSRRYRKKLRRSQRPKAMVLQEVTSMSLLWGRRRSPSIQGVSTWAASWGQELVRQGLWAAGAGKWWP